jgi:hypothetical protein
MGSGSVYNKESYMLVIPRLDRGIQSPSSGRIIQEHSEKKLDSLVKPGNDGFCDAIATQLSKPEYHGI